MKRNVVGVLKNIWNHPMARGKRLKVFGRFFSWQLVGKHLAQKGVIKDWFEDRKLLVYPDRACATGNYYLGLLEYQEMAFLLHYARPEDTFADCGANIGVYTVLLGKICNWGISIEASSETFEILKRNVNINNLKSVKIECRGVGDAEGEVTFSKGLDCVNHVVDDHACENQACETIKVSALDTLCGNEKKPISIIKIDTEGYEEKVLQGASVILDSPECNVVIMETFGDSRLEDMLKEKGFNLYMYNPKTRTLVLSDHQEEGDNGIFIKDIEVAKKRVESCGKINIYGVEL